MKALTLGANKGSYVLSITLAPGCNNPLTDA
jgi:hypothetical protein